MKLDYLKYSVDNVLHRRMRSSLTIISILIGIAAIYALVSFGQGLSIYVEDISTQMGVDKLMIMSKGLQSSGFDLDFYIAKEEVDFLGKIRGIETIVGTYLINAEVEHKKQKRYAFGMSFPTGGKAQEIFKEMMTVDLEKGRFLKDGDTSKVVLGYNYLFDNEIFDRRLVLGDKITVNGVSVEVVGFFEQIGNPQDDSNIYFTEEGLLAIEPDTKDKFQWVLARVASDFNPTEVGERAEEKFRKYKGQKEGQEDFTIQTFEQAMEMFTNIFGIVNGVLVLIALISMVVAAVNIMNTMYTAVLERTQEIGVMKAIGARNSDIMVIFIFESGLLGIIGGLLGIGLGYLISSGGGAIAAGAGYTMLQPAFPWQLTLGCLLFAFFVGAFSGFFPARQASKLKPVDALRYE